MGRVNNKFVKLVFFYGIQEMDDADPEWENGIE
jgi:hypothetical protein